MMQRYQIQKYLCKIGATALFVAYDNLSESEVLLDFWIPGNTTSLAWQAFLSYQREWLRWCQRMDNKITLSISHFAEYHLGENSAWDTQLQSYIGSFLGESKTFAYWITPKPTECKFLAEVHLETDDLIKSLAIALQKMHWIHEKGMLVYSVSPFHIMLLPTEHSWEVCFRNVGLVPPGFAVAEAFEYAAPEVAHARISIQSDLYALANVYLQEILHTSDITQMDLAENLSQANIPEICAKALIQAVSPQPYQRWHNAAEFLNAIQPLAPDVQPLVVSHANASPSYTAPISCAKQPIEAWLKNPEKEPTVFFYTLTEDVQQAFCSYIREIAQAQPLRLMEWHCAANRAFPLLEWSDFLPNFDTIYPKDVESPHVLVQEWDAIYHRVRSQVIATLVSQIQTPFLLLISNLQWAYEDFLDYLFALLLEIATHIKKISQPHVIIIGIGYFSTKSPAWEKFVSNVKQHPMLQNWVQLQDENLLDATYLQQYLAEFLGLKEAPAKFSAWLSRVSQSKPIYAKLLLQLLLQKGMLYREDGAWCISAMSLEDFKIPKTLDQAISDWLETLPKQASDILEILATAGWPFSLDILLNAMQNPETVIPILWRLYQDQILYITTELQVAIASNDIYEYLKPRCKVSATLFHRLIEVWTRSTMRHKIFLITDLLLQQKGLAATHLWTSIFNYLGRLGLCNSLENWIKRLRSYPVTDAKLASIAGYWAMAVDQYDWAAEYWEPLAQKKAEEIVWWHLANLAILQKNSDRVTLYLKQLRQTRAEFWQACYYITKTVWNWEQKQIPESIKNFQKALSIFENSLPELQVPGFLLDYILSLDKIFWENVVDAETQLKWALAIAQHLQHAAAEMKLYLWIAAWQRYRGSYSDALSHFQKTLELSHTQYDPEIQMQAILGMIDIYCTLANPKKVSNLLQQAIHISQKENFTSYQTSLALAQARLALLQEPDTADELYKKAWEYSQPQHADLSWILSEWSVLWIGKDEKQALKIWGQAMEALQKTYSPLREIQVNLAKLKIDYASEQPVDLLLETSEKILSKIQQYHYEAYRPQLYYYQGLAYRTTGNIQAALENFKAAQADLEKQTSHLPKDIREQYFKLPQIAEMLQTIASLSMELPLDDPKLGNSLVPWNMMESSVAQYRSEMQEKTLEQQRDEVGKLRRLLEINTKLNREHDLRKLLDLIMDTAIEITKAERGFLILSTTEKKDFEVARNFEKEDIANPEFEVSHSITEKIIHTGIPILTADALQDERFDGYRSVSELKLHSVLAVPLRVHEKIIGALYLDNRFETSVFLPSDKEILEAFATQAAIAIETAQLIAENTARQEELKKSKEQIEKLNQRLATANAKLAQKIERKDEELQEAKEVLQQSQAELTARYQYHHLIGRSSRMQEVFKILDKVTDKTIPVLVYGESGTGKELVARAIHFSGNRKSKNFLSENCAAISETLLASELFGHVKGAFTGAYIDKKGLFELADGGTLFLDEVGDMSPSMQANLLRVLETNVIRRVGGKEEIPVDVRIISASNKNLTELVSQGIFREDLLFRLKVVEIVLPTLRERKEDIPLLVEYFLAEYAQENKCPVRRLDKKAMAILMHYNWPGNVRELKNTLYNVLSLHDEEELSAQHFKILTNNPNFKVIDFFSQEMSIDEYARLFVLHKQNQYNDSQLARILGFSRKTLWEKRKKWSLFRA